MSVGVLAVVIARLGVSFGRLIYSLHTGYNAFGDDRLPAWHELLLQDGFFYVGILALIGCIVFGVLRRKAK